MLQKAKAWARELKRDVTAVWLAARDPRTPWWVKLIAGAVAAYALSPIDLIPDFVPVLGYLDDLLIVPLGILLVVRLMPVELMSEFRAKAAAYQRPHSYAGVAIVIVLWTVGVALTVWWLWVGRNAGA